jgi:Uma2 family endonuclease
MGSVQATRKMTAEEFLAFEEASEEKHEYFDGEVVAMAGGGFNHNTITGNAYFNIRAALKNKCKIYMAETRVQTKAMNTYTYPDVVIACDEMEFLEGKTATLTNPTVIIEVLSPSTEDYDRSKKFVRYKLIPSLQTYILILTEEKKVEIFTKKDSFTWEHREYTEGSFSIEPASVTLDIEKLYEGVVIEPIVINETPTRF